jgi:hypothetical protein
MIIYDRIDCNRCYGEGILERGPFCFKPASDCCGGCYEETVCELCEGEGYLEPAEDDYEGMRAYNLYQETICRIKHPSELFMFEKRLKFLSELLNQHLESIRL